MQLVPVRLITNKIHLMCGQKAPKFLGFITAVTFCIGLLALGGCKFFCPEPKLSDNVTIITCPCQLTRLLDAQPWPLQLSDNLTITGDIEISGSVTIHSYDLSYTDNYVRSSFWYPIIFADDFGGQGIEILENKPVGRQGWGMQKLTLSNIKLRLRKVTEYAADVNAPMVTILPPSDQPCGEGQRRCPDDLVCYDTDDDPYWRSYCIQCEKLSLDECACRDAQGTALDNGTECIYGVDDAPSIGTCRGGVCETGAAL